MAITKICPTCNRSFQVKPSNNYRIYCGMKCYHESRAINLYEITCAACGKSFFADYDGAKYCSRDCMSVGFRQKECKRCARCGNSFEIKPYQSHKEFCSRKCRDAHRKSASTVTGVCLHCKQTFAYKAFWPQKYCSPQCRNDARTSRIKKICEYCGDQFVVRQYRSHARYCSKLCSENAGRVTKECPMCKTHFVIVANKADQTCCSRRCANKFKKRTYIEIQVAQWLSELSVEYTEQHRVGSFTCDFYINKHNLIIETDGEYWHSLPKVIDRDRRKTAYLERLGYQVLRLPELSIRNSPEWCKEQIIHAFDRTVRK